MVATPFSTMQHCLVMWRLSNTVLVSTWKLKGKVKTFQMILINNKYFSSCNYEGETALHLGVGFHCKENSLDILQEFIKVGANLGARLNVVFIHLIDSLILVPGLCQEKILFTMPLELVTLMSSSFCWIMEYLLQLIQNLMMNKVKISFKL